MNGLCIICKKIDELTDEHIIPEFLGGDLIIKNVCKTCNDKMGGTFEGRLSNNEIFTFPNFINNISGKSVVPNPLSGTKKTTTGEKVFVEFEKNKLKVKSHPVISIKSNAREDVFSISIDPSDLDKAEEIIRKKINRHYKDMPEETREKLVNKLYQDCVNSPITETPPPIIQDRFFVNFKDLELLFIKIAYEIGFYNFGENYIDDPVAEKLRVSLDNQFEEKIKVGFFPDIGYMKGLFLEGKHYICLAKNICYIKIHGIDAMICISEANSAFDISQQDLIIYDFDYINKKHIKQTLAERIMYLNFQAG